MRIIVNKTKAIIAAAMVAFFGGYGIFFILERIGLAAVVFLALAILFGWVLYKNARTVAVDVEGVRQSFLGITGQSLRWDQVREVGLIGEGVFNKKGNSGDKYIYFSSITMTPDERFDMIVKWPPKKDVVYVEYSERTLEYCMTLWHGELKTYNVEDLFPNTGEPKGSHKK